MKCNSLELTDLPVVFDLDELIEWSDGDRNLAITRLHRWEINAFVQRFKQDSFVYFNLKKDPAAPLRFSDHAMIKAHPDAMIAGVSALHRAGWTTQIPAKTELVINQSSCGDADGVASFSLMPRSEDHLEILKSKVLPGDVPVLEPAWALADLLLYDLWHPSEDDLEMDEIEQAMCEIEEAFKTLGVSLDRLPC